jgi:hypothetical protein
MRHSEDFACQRLHSTAMTYKIVLIGLFIVISTIQTRIVEKGWDHLHPWIERGCLSLRRAVYPFGGHARRRAQPRHVRRAGAGRVPLSPSCGLHSRRGKANPVVETLQG